MIDKLRAATVAEFGEIHWQAMYNIILNESNFNPFARNSKSGACGIFQANPCSKLPCELGDVDCQIAWGIHYVKNRYINPTLAWNFYLAQGWY